jgi:hypothetical protein
VIGVLVLLYGGREHDGWFDAPDDGGEFAGVGGTDFEMGVAVELDELNGGTENFCGVLGFFSAFGRRSIGASFAARANDEMDWASGLRFAGDDAAAAELDVVGVGAEGKERKIKSGSGH